MRLPGRVDQLTGGKAVAARIPPVDVNLNNRALASQHNARESGGHGQSWPMGKKFVSGRGVRMWFSAVVVGMVAGWSAAAPADAGRAEGTTESRVTAAQTGWLDLFVSVMQEVLWHMGGDAVGCDTSSPDKAMAGFRSRFNQIGVPSGLSPQDKAALAAAASEMDELLANAPLNASDLEVRLTRSTIAPLQSVPVESSQIRSSP